MDRAPAGLATHEVLRVIGERTDAGSRPGQRTDGLRVALAIEGGGMRGTVSAGMALALHELGLVPAFDAVYGASAGAITGAWLLSSNPGGLRGWAEPSYAQALIRWRALLRGRPVVDVRTLIEVVYQTQWPMDFGSVLASDIEFHPLATDAATGASTDLRPLIAGPAELRLALRASASLPFLAGPPVRVGGRRFYDAGVAEAIPFRTPLAQGATHVLVLRSRRPLAAALAKVGMAPQAAAAPVPEAAAAPVPGAAAAPVPGAAAAPVPGAAAAPVPEAAAAPVTKAAGRPRGPRRRAGPAQPSPPRSVRLLARTTMRNESPELRAALLTRGVRTAADIARIAELEAAGQALSIVPPPGAPPVSRLTTDGGLLAAAFEAGREAVYASFYAGLGG